MNKEIQEPDQKQHRQIIIYKSHAHTQKRWGTENKLERIYHAVFLLKGIKV